MLPIYDLSAQLETLLADDYLPAFSAATSTTQLPTAITVPLIYANTTLENSAGFQVADLLTPSADTLDNEARFALLEQHCQQAGVDIVVESSALDFYVPIYVQGIEAYAQTDGYTTFLKEEALVYLGEYGAYEDVSTTLPGEYCVLLPSDHEPLTRNQTLWSVLTHDADANMVASTLIGDFVTEGGQGLFHLDSDYNSNALPVCTSVLSTFIGLYPELSALDSYLNPA